tara:strand:- start:169 stop:864 length:696 start_codon:yes stop_codon:yes gene_type:complete
MKEKVFSTSDLIQQIRDYQKQHPILLEKSHHFVFDCPLNNDKKNCKPDYLFIGINPGDDTSDWSRTNNENAEETRDSNFQEDFGRSTNSKSRMTKLKNFLGEIGEDIFDKTTHTELFFWCSKDKDKDFIGRYGHSYESSPHLEFCIRLNKSLIDRIEPKAIFLESHENMKYLKNYFHLNKLKVHQIGQRKVIEYLLEDKYLLINFDHQRFLSSRPEKGEIIETIGDIIHRR